MVSLRTLIVSTFTERETLLAGEIFIRVLYVEPAALSDNVQVLAGL
jgi:hypothetical protein